MKLLDKQRVIINTPATQPAMARAIVQLFAEHGASITLLTTDQAAARRLTNEIGEQHLTLVCDTTERESCDAALRQFAKDVGWIDALVNISGMPPPFGLMDITAQSYTAALDVSLRSTICVSQAVTPYMKKQRAGSIVNLVSLAGQRAGYGAAALCTTARESVTALSRAMARELAPNQIRVNSVCPGFINTELTAGNLSHEDYESMVSRIPMGRAGHADDVAGCCLFLASRLSTYVTGTELDVNGGAPLHSL